MARRTRTTVAEELIDIVALLPWWSGVVLALVLYAVLHQLSLQPVVVAVQPGQMGAAMTKNVFKAFASIGQYLLPIICLLGAGLSAWRRRERKQLLASVVRTEETGVLDGMTWQQFEMLVGEGFRQQGYQVVETGGGGADGGVDLVLKKNGEKYLVQCKQWRAFKVGVEVVRELYGAMAAGGATGGFVVTSGRFSEEASRFAEGRNVVLIDGARLSGLLRSPGAVSPPARPRAIRSAQPSDSGSAARESPSCPVCGKPMTRRVAKRGTNAGQEFLGCTGYPSCRGTRPVV
jgi:restriction system protein